MVSRISGIGLIFGCLFLTIPGARALEVSATATNGGTYNLTDYTNWVHFTATANNVASVSATLTGGIPNVASTAGTAFSSFTESFTNGSGSGEISAADNASAVNVQYAAGPQSNSRVWFGAWGASEGVSFQLTVPTAAGTMLLFSAGNNTAAAGGASLTASFTAPVENQNATFTASGTGSWGALFTVNWAGRTVGDVMTLQFANVPAGGGGNAGLIAVVVPEPSTSLLSVAATVFLAMIAKSRRKHAIVA